MVRIDPRGSGEPLGRLLALKTPPKCPEMGSKGPMGHLGPLTLLALLALRLVALWCVCVSVACDRMRECIHVCGERLCVLCVWRACERASERVSV